MESLIEIQQQVFAQKPNRLDLINYESRSISGSDSGHELKVFVYRNHNFELIANTIGLYLDFAGLKASFSYSDYDDSLSFEHLDRDADLIIVWLDLSRYETEDLEGFIKERISFLRKSYSKNLLLMPLLSKQEIEVEGVISYSFKKWEEELKERFLDSRFEALTGTKLSQAACLAVSRDLGLNYIPALSRPSLKGIVVDLDNTLYKGVLGEEGPLGVELTEGHLSLQKRLKVLAQQGFFLCIASKNDERDVEALFKQRSDFALKWEDFSKVCANWDEKASSITEIAKFLNIDSSALLMVDDNLGELVSVRQRHPAIRVIWAQDDAQVTKFVLDNYPGLLKLKQSQEDLLRQSDVQSKHEREHLAKSLSQEQYLKSLNLQLHFALNDFEGRVRLAELSNKTNQFIFSYKRYSESEVIGLMEDPEVAVVSISLKDRLSNSGNIGALILRKEKEVAILEECFVSCRALGRGIDEAIVLGAIGYGLEQLGVKKLQVLFTQGERNLPAEKFCEKVLKPYLKESCAFSYEDPIHLIEIIRS